MNALVADASVGVKWLLKEEHSEAATSLLRSTDVILVPDLFYVEVSRGLWKRIPATLSETEVSERIAELRTFSLQVVEARSVLQEAVWLSKRFALSFYDGVYLAIAEGHKVQLVSADWKLVNAARERGSKRVLHVSEWKPSD